MSKLCVSPDPSVKILSAIFEFMTQLEELSIEFKDPKKRLCADSVLTGIPNEVCKIIREERNWKNVSLHEVKTRPGISDLKREAHFSN